MTKENAPAKLRAGISRLLQEHSDHSLTARQILQALGMRGDEMPILMQELQRMQVEGMLIKTARDRYGLPGRLNCLSGTLQGNRRGFAFLRPDVPAEDVFIGSGAMKDAVHGDRVMVRLTGTGGKKKRRREGEVIGILKRGQSRLVGTLSRRGKNYYVTPDEDRLSRIVELPSRNLAGARPGDKVVVEIRSWGHGNRPHRGQLVEVIGPAGSPRTEQAVLHRKYDLPGEFPPQVEKELSSLPREEEIPRIAAEEGREILGGLPMVTIDDEQARDFDDAVSLEELADDGCRLGIHIADVSRYVRERKAIDREALKRSTSTYLVDRVIHMLPPLLSEKLCSLRAGRDRLAVSVLIDLSPNAEVTAYRFFPSLIRVTERLTYRQVESHLEGDGGAIPSGLGEMLSRMDAFAAQLRRRRLKRGSLDLDMPEVRFVLDEKGIPVDVQRRRMGRAESLIEEFMILCNEVIAAHFFKEKIPFLYRVHAEPTAEKLAFLRETLTLMGNPLAAELKEIRPHHLRKLLEQSSGEQAEKLVRYLVLRSLPQARYSAANEGHFGLASRFYCHFTSPIRRYPDLVIHRILKEYLAGEDGLPEKRLASLQSRLPPVALHASERERAAMEAERASADQKKAQFMENKIGEVYPGIINGVTNFGIFVELENTIEGMIPLSDLDDDYYAYIENQAALVGQRTRKRYRLGDPVTVQVVRVDRARGNITFNLA